MFVADQQHDLSVSVRVPEAQYSDPRSRALAKSARWMSLPIEMQSSTHAVVVGFRNIDTQLPKAGGGAARAVFPDVSVDVIKRPYTCSGLSAFTNSKSKEGLEPLMTNSKTSKRLPDRWRGATCSWLVTQLRVLYGHLRRRALQAANEEVIVVAVHDRAQRIEGED